MALFICLFGLLGYHFVGGDYLNAYASVCDFKVAEHICARYDEGEGLDIAGLHLHADHAVEVVCDELVVKIHLDDVGAELDAGAEIVPVLGLNDEIITAGEGLGDGYGQA